MLGENCPHCNMLRRSSSDTLADQPLSLTFRGQDPGNCVVIDRETRETLYTVRSEVKGYKHVTEILNANRLLIASYVYSFEFELGAS